MRLHKLRVVCSFLDVPEAPPVAEAASAEDFTKSSTITVLFKLMSFKASLASLTNWLRFATLGRVNANVVGVKAMLLEPEAMT